MDTKLDDCKSQYDCVVKLNSLLGLDFNAGRGWNLEFSPEALSRISEKIKDIRTTKISPDNVTTISNMAFENEMYRKRVCLVGLYDRGKTYVVNKLCGDGTQLTSSVLAHTEGISIKVPSGNDLNQIMFLDSQGTNSPLEQSMVKDFITQLTEVKKTVNYADGEEEDIITQSLIYLSPKQDNDNDNNQQRPPANAAEVITDSYEVDDPNKLMSEADRNKIEDEEKQRRKDIAAKGRNKAIISKQSTEVVLQDIVITASDVVMTVVNEITFEDQLSCEYVVRKLQDSRVRSADRWGQLVVIHNFKTITDKVTLDGMVQKYVMNCFDGIMIKKEVTIIESGNAKKTSIDLYTNKDNSMLHIWIAREGTEAGADNDIKFEFLRRYSSAATQSHTRSLLADVIISTTEVLRERSYFVSMSDVSLYKLDDRLSILAQGKKVSMGGQTTVHPLQLAPDEVVMEGKTLTFIQPGDFVPSYDVLFTEDGMKVVMDVPGLTKKTDKVEVGPDRTRHSVKPPVIDHQTNELVIEGSRLLYFPEVVLQGATYTYVKDWDQKMKVYTRDSENYGVTVTRRKGHFVKRIKVPPKYDRQAKLLVELRFGVLYVFIPKLKEVSSDSSDDEEEGEVKDK